jgi:hypothetical protein
MGYGRRIACLAKHKTQLTPACRNRLELMQAVFDMGQKARAKDQAYWDKHDPEEAKAFRRRTLGPDADKPAAPKTAAQKSTAPK